MGHPIPPPPWEIDPGRFPIPTPEIMSHYGVNYNDVGERESLDLPPGGGESPSAGSGSHAFDVEQEEFPQVRGFWSYCRLLYPIERCPY